MNISKRGKITLAVIIVLFILAIVINFVGMKDVSSFANKNNNKYVAVVRIDGPIYGGDVNQNMLGGVSRSSSEDIMYELREATRDPNAKAVLLRINSPGGTTGATQEIAEEIDKVRNSGKPVIVSMGDTCASAGYWLASKGDYIFASPATITGSIGVYMDYTNVSELMDKLGVKNEKIKSGTHKDILSMYRPITDEEKTILQKMVDDIYNQFVQTIADGRHLEEAKVREIADGRILTGKQAQAYGLVDAMGNYYDALTYAGNRVGINSDVIPTRSYSKGMTLRGLLSAEMNSTAQNFASRIVDEAINAMSEKTAVVR